MANTDMVDCFFLNDPAPTEIYTLPLHDALPICPRVPRRRDASRLRVRALATHRPAHRRHRACTRRRHAQPHRSEEHTSELQSRQYLVCRLLLEKKKSLPLPTAALALPASARMTP